MDTQARDRRLEILLVEDNAGDLRLTMEALGDGPMSSNRSVAGDGMEAMALLRREGRYAQAARPDLILLDLKLPKKDGHEVLEEIKGTPSLRRIPVVILTNSTAEADILKAYDLQANCYIVKPLDLDEFSAVVKSVENFWGALVELPAK